MDAKNSGVEQSRPRYTLRWASQAFEEALPINWVVEGVLAVPGVGVLFGGPGTKKTYTALHLAVSVAMGKEWLGHSVQQGTVLIIDEESGEQRLDLRLAQVMRGLLAPVDIPLAYVSLANFQLSNQRDVVEIEGLVGQVQPRLVIVDALTDVAPGDENSSKDMQPIMQTLRYLAARYACAILILHHSTKSGKTYRGSSVIKAAAELMLAVESKDGQARVNFTSDKTRDGQAFTFAGHAIWSGEDKDNLTFTLQTTTKAVPTPHINQTQRCIIDFLTREGQGTMKDIQGYSQSQNCTAKATDQAVRQLTKAAVLRRVDGGGQGSTGTWEVVLESNGHHPELL